MRSVPHIANVEGDAPHLAAGLRPHSQGERGPHSQMLKRMGRPVAFKALPILV